MKAAFALAGMVATGRSAAIVISLCRATVPLVACTSSASTSAQAAAPQGPQQGTQAAAIAQIVQGAMKTDQLKAVIIKVTEGGNTVASQAFGESMNGVPATTAMHFRNGAVAFQYVATLLMEFVDEHK